MRQSEGINTSDPSAGVKRGRGRPRAENPLTPAERAKRYRDNRRAAGLGRASNIRDGVTNNNDNQTMLVPVDLLQAEQERAATLYSMVELMLDYREKKKPIPPDIMARLILAFARL